MRHLLFFPAITALALVIAACTVDTVGRSASAPSFSGTIHQGAPAIVVDGMGSNAIHAGRQIVNRMMGRAFREGRPIRLSGRFVSAGTFMLYAADNIAGSCVEPGAVFSFHRAVHMASALTIVPIALTGPEGAEANAAIAETYRPALANWFLIGIENGMITANFTELRGRDLARFGYTICYVD